MHRGVLYGVIAFGLAVGLGAFVYALATGWSLALAAKVAAILVGGLVLHPLKFVALRPRLRSDRRETLGVALLVFALLVAAGGIVVGVVGRGPWLGAAAGLVAIAVAFAAAGMFVLRHGDRRRTAPDAIRWHG